MRLRRTLLVAVAAVSLGAPDAAQADTENGPAGFSSVPAPAFMTGVSLAPTAFGSLGNCTAITYGYATATGANAGDAAWGKDCVIRVNIAFLVTLSQPEQCTLGEHEFGHAVLNLPHVDDPLAIMYPKPSPSVECLAAYPPALHMNVQPNGRTRSPRSRSDRKWCRAHSPKCAVKYPRLYAASVRPHR